jgi:spore photoproduct lyase
MKFEKIFLEEHLIEHPRAKQIIARFPQSEVRLISKVEDVFGRVKKPYLQKRTNLNLFLGEKKGQLVKVAPPAYGLSGEPHYYFVHAYNCIYECNYCYLQGYFQSPDIVLFLNHEEIGDEIKKLADEFALTNPGRHIWFHAGEYSDSLALSHLTGELPAYFELFRNLPNARLELRTKSVNIKEILKEKPANNVITSFSLAPEHRTKINDLKTPPLRARLEAIRELHEHGHKIGIHFDPIIYDEKLEESYTELINDLTYVLPPEAIEYISIGVVRFTKNVYLQVTKNYPESDFLADDFTNSFDGKMRYNRPMRMWMLGKVKSLLIDAGIPSAKIYECMEEEIAGADHDSEM